MYKLVIFDLDGTLVDSLEDLGNACNEALSRFGYPVHPMDSFRYFVGDGVPMLIRRALPEAERSEEKIAEVKAVFDDIYGRNYNVCTRPYEGIPQLLQRLKSEGILIAVASNKPDNFTQTIVSGMFGDIFSYVSGKKEGFEKKPSPQIALNIIAVGRERLDHAVVAPMFLIAHLVHSRFSSPAARSPGQSCRRGAPLRAGQIF